MSQEIFRLGIFGGAFDPPHHAHVALVKAAMAQLHLDALRVFPTGQSWHRAGPTSSGVHRLAMARLAFEHADGLAGVSVDDRELRREGATYTIDTVRELHAQYPQVALHLVIGEDQAAAFTQWRDWRALLALASLAVARRPASPGIFDASRLPGARVEMLDLPAMPVSATAVRTLAAETSSTWQNLVPMVPEAVARYIAEHHLYRTA